eukprot:g67153.t1
MVRYANQPNGKFNFLKIPNSPRSLSHPPPSPSEKTENFPGKLEKLGKLEVYCDMADVVTRSARLPKGWARLFVSVRGSNLLLLRQGRLGHFCNSSKYLRSNSCILETNTKV